MGLSQIALWIYTNMSWLCCIIKIVLLNSNNYFLESIANQAKANAGMLKISWL